MVILIFQQRESRSGAHPDMLCGMQAATAAGRSCGAPIPDYATPGEAQRVRVFWCAYPEFHNVAPGNQNLNDTSPSPCLADACLPGNPGNLAQSPVNPRHPARCFRCAQSNPGAAVRTKTRWQPHENRRHASQRIPSIQSRQ